MIARRFDEAIEVYTSPYSSQIRRIRTTYRIDEWAHSNYSKDHQALQVKAKFKILGITGDNNMLAFIVAIHGTMYDSSLVMMMWIFLIV